VWVTEVAEHDGPALYKWLSDELGISAVGRGREHKPGCCGDDVWPTIGTTRGRGARPAMAPVVTP
jgi:hypothetical protein